MKSEALISTENFTKTSSSPKEKACSIIEPLTSLSSLAIILTITIIGFLSLATFKLWCADMYISNCPMPVGVGL